MSEQVKLCPTCGQPMRSFVYREDSPWGMQIVEYGDACDECGTMKLWSYGENFYRLNECTVTQKEWVEQYMKMIKGKEAQDVPLSLRKDC